MDGWKTIRLGDLCVTNADSYSPREEWDFVNYFDTGNSTNNRIDSIQYIDTSFQVLNKKSESSLKKQYNESDKQS